jgi:hypothetical protein
VRLLRTWDLLHGKRAPSRACPTERRLRPASDRPASRLTWGQADRPLEMLHRKRFAWRQVVPVVLAMVRLLGIAIGFFVGCLLARALIELLRP